MNWNRRCLRVRKFSQETLAPRLRGENTFIDRLLRQGRSVPRLGRPNFETANSPAVIYAPLVIDTAILKMMRMVLTGWLERRKREAIAYLVEENMSAYGMALPPRS